MAEMVCSALVQETVSRGVSFVLGKREERASQSDLMEKLEMAASELEFVLERAQELPIKHISLLVRRNKFKSAYLEALELLDKHKQQQVVPAAAGHELQVAQGVKRRRWVTCAKNMSLNPLVALTMDVVRRFEWYVEHAGRFLRDLESGCSLHHYTFCNPIVRHLLEGKTLLYAFEQGNLRRGFYIWPTYSDERGVEAVLLYSYHDRTMAEKNFRLLFILRLSESTDIFGAAIKGFQLLTSQFKVAAEFAIGELTLLSNLQDIAHSYEFPWAGIQDFHINSTQFSRPDPACCKGSRHNFCPNNYVSSELSDVFTEEVIFWYFKCYYVPALKPRSRCSPFDVVGRSTRGGGKPPLLLSAAFFPHYVTVIRGRIRALEIIGGVEEYRDASSIQQVAEAVNKSDPINCFFRQAELTEYEIFWFSKHGCAAFWVEKENVKRTGGPKTRRSYNTRGSTRRSHKR